MRVDECARVRVVVGGGGELGRLQGMEGQKEEGEGEAEGGGSWEG